MDLHNMSDGRKSDAGDNSSWPPAITQLPGAGKDTKQISRSIQGLGGCLGGFVAAIALAFFTTQIQVWIGLSLPGTFIRRAIFETLAFPVEALACYLIARRLKTFAIVFMIVSILTTVMNLMILRESYRWSDLFGLIGV